MKTIAIVAGGPVDYYPDLMMYHQKDTVWIGVDRGVYHLLQLGITPKVAFGDFDSLSDTERIEALKQVEIVYPYPKEKDATDLELAIDWALQKQPANIFVFGATGGRLDHGLMNVQLLIKSVQMKVEMWLIDKQNKLTLKEPGCYDVKQTKNYHYLSFLPFSSMVEQLTIAGVKYPLQNETLALGSSLCVSNEIVANKATFSFTDGLLLILQSKDEKQ